MKKIVINETKNQEVITRQEKKYNVEFKNEDNDLMIITKDKHQLKMKILKKKIKGKNQIEKENDKIKYKDIEEGIDLEYQCQENKIKESLIIKERQEKYEYDFEMDIGELKPIFNTKDNTLELQQEGQTIYKIQSPYMEDASHQRSDNCLYQIEQEGKILTIHLQCDEQWINKKERVFPIIVDPTIEVRNNEATIEVNEIKKEGEGIEYEIGQQGKAKIKLSERDFMYEHNDNIMLKQNQMCLNLSHIYEEKEKEENKAYLGKGWRSNIHQNIKKEAYDEEKGYQKIIYTDGNKKEHIFKEYWYYNDINGNKVYINRKQIYLDSDQKLKYQVDEQHIYEVKNEVKNEEHLTLIQGSLLNEFPNKQIKKKK